MCAEDAPAAAPQRILLIKPSSLGDVIHALPVLAGLRRAYPQAHIAWLLGSTFAPLLAKHPLLDEVIPFDRRHYGRMLQSARSFADFVRFVADLRRRRFDLVVDLQGLLRSGFLTWSTGASRRVGFAHARELAWLFYNERCRCRDGGSDTHAVELNLRLARALKLPVDPPQFPLALSDQELAAARSHIVEAAGKPVERFVAVIPGTRWESKHWPPEYLGQLLQRMHAAGMPPAVLLGAPDDRAFAERVLAACASPVVNLVGRTSLRELAAAIAQSELVVCHDSGPMHIAAALDKPLVAVFGPTNPVRTGPYSPRARVVSVPLSCAPCYERECPLKHHNCMRQLPVEQVFAEVRETLAAKNSAPHAAQ